MAAIKIPESALDIKNRSDDDCVRVVGANGKSYRVPAGQFTGPGSISDTNVTFTTSDSDTPSAWESMSVMVPAALSTILATLSKAVSNVRWLYNNIKSFENVSISFSGRYQMISKTWRQGGNIRVEVSQGVAPVATSSNVGYMSSADKIKLDAISTGASAATWSGTSMIIS